MAGCTFPYNVAVVLSLTQVEQRAMLHLHGTRTIIGVFYTVTKIVIGQSNVSIWLPQ